MRSHANGFDKLGKRKKQWCATAALHFSFAKRHHHKQFNFHLSLMSATKVEISQARQDKGTAVHGNAISKEYLPISRGATSCAFRLFSNDNKVAMKILLSSKSERCDYSFRRNLLFQMTYLMQCGPWFVANCHVFYVIKQFAILAGDTLCAIKKRIPKAPFLGKKLCLFQK